MQRPLCGHLNSMHNETAALCVNALREDKGQLATSRSQRRLVRQLSDRNGFLLGAGTDVMRQIRKDVDGGTTSQPERTPNCRRRRSIYCCGTGLAVGRDRGRSEADLLEKSPRSERRRKTTAATWSSQSMTKDGVLSSATSCPPSWLGVTVGTAICVTCVYRRRSGQHNASTPSVYTMATYKRRV